jgi:hypothetical protein
MINEPKTESQSEGPPNGGRRTRVGNSDSGGPKYIVLTKDLTVKELAAKATCLETEIIKRLMMKGFMRTLSQIVELVLAREVASDMGFTVLEDEKSVPEQKELQ